MAELFDLTKLVAELHLYQLLSSYYYHSNSE